MVNSQLAILMINDGYWTPWDVQDTWLAALDAAGVDNWEGYDEAREFFKQMAEEARKEANVQTNA